MSHLAIKYLEATVQRFPNKAAIHDGERTLSFQQLWKRSCALAQHLQRRDRVVVCIEKSLEAILGIVASQMVGAIYVPFDTKTPIERREKMLAKLGPHSLLERTKEGFRLDGHELVLAGGSDASFALARRGAHEPLYIMFTSGTTGIPKGVTISNAAVVDYIEWVIAEYAISGSEVIGNGVPLFFDGSVLDLYLMFAKGCSLHLIPPLCMRFPADLVEYIKTQRVSLIFFVPSALTPLAVLDQLKDVQLPDLKKVLFIGEPMPLNTLRYLRSRLPDVLLGNQYGPTEATVAKICWKAGSDLSGLSETPIGEPCANTSVLLIDGDGDVVREADTVGEIYLGGLGVALGYWGDPEETRLRFVQNPTHNNFRDMFYKTGDLGYRSSKDGLYYTVGRKDDQFKHLGHRIEPGEIEAAVVRVDGVAQCSVNYDAARRQIVAFVLGPRVPEFKDLRISLKSSLPSYMLPHRVEVVAGFPQTPNGKVDKMRLWQEFLARDPG